MRVSERTIVRPIRARQFDPSSKLRSPPTGPILRIRFSGNGAKQEFCVPRGAARQLAFVREYISVGLSFHRIELVIVENNLSPAFNPNNLKRCSISDRVTFRGSRTETVSDTNVVRF